MRKLIQFICFFFCFWIYSTCLCSQNTVGVTSVDVETVTDGYTLLYPLYQSNVYLINNCGEVVHEWLDSTLYRPGNAVYLLKNGDLLKTKKPNAFIPGSFSSGGSGAIVELLSWDNELKWSKKIVDSTFRMHHDIEPLPNGNVLIIVWQRRSREEFIEAGGDIESIDIPEIWPDIIHEYDPVLDSFVWTWDSWNHLVQDFDSGKNNYGVVSEEIGKINLNFERQGISPKPDWLHINSIDYNEELDQILLSTPNFEEIWIIDHSTTTEEAKGDTGGQYGKGGQLLFRWGNPQAFKSGDSEDKKLFFQHDAQWLNDPSLESHLYYNQIALFNNRINSNTSAINIIEPALDNVSGEYIVASGTYLPSIFNETIESSSEVQFQSSNMSGIQLLPNGNYFICSAQRGSIFEITPDEKVVWSYVLPFRNGFRVSQGSNLNIGDNVLFRANKYSKDYPALIDKDLSSMYYLELNPDLEFCDLMLNTEETYAHDFLIYPVPAQNFLTIKSVNNTIETLSIYSNIGLKMENLRTINSKEYILDTSTYPNGLYHIILNNNYIYKVLINRN